MRRFRWVSAACWLALLSTLLYWHTAAASSPLKCGIWSIMPSPSPGSNGNYFYGVSAVSSTDVWAVGGYGPSGGGALTLIEHWNGSQWNVIPSPNPSPDINYLYSVSAVSSSDVWTVGIKDALTLIEHWDGSQWSVVPSPNPSSNADYLYGVSAVSSTDVWAVGYSSPPSGGTYTLIEHWDGSQWSVVSSPSPGPAVNYLYGVSAVSSTDAWAVGYYSPPSGGNYTLIEHWNGAQWSVVSSPSPGPAVNYLYGVSAISTTNAWAVGGDSPPKGGAPTLSEQWNGTRWHKVKSPSPGAFANLLYSVSALSSTNAWAVGYSLPNPSTVFTLTEHWNGSRWKVVQSPNPGPANLRGVALVPGTSQAWAVGYYSNGSDEQTLTEFYC